MLPGNIRFLLQPRTQFAKANAIGLCMDRGANDLVWQMQDQMKEPRETMYVTKKNFFIKEFNLLYRYTLPHRLTLQQIIMSFRLS